MLRKTLLTSVFALLLTSAFAQNNVMWNQGHEGNSFVSKTLPDQNVNKDKVVFISKQNAHEHTQRINGAVPPTNPYVFGGSKPQFSPTTRVGWHLFFGYTFVRNLVTL
ncbi:hypothetical protein HZ996_05450 [Cryomorphaceae bacterium]|nr:hypothetical protein HZ996_05450 [Cryomorphaceae bacterium]